MRCSRRTFVKLAGQAALVVSTGGNAQSVNQVPPYSDPAITDAWIRAWMESLGAVNETLHLGRFADPTYFLRKNIGWTPNPGQEGSTVDVPIGFVTDFASIPRVFWSVLPKDGVYTYPAIIHDYLYWVQSTPRDQADSVLKYAMEDFKVGSVQLQAIYQAVKAGGGVAWSDNARRKKSGEKRVLAKFPESPTITWAEWKVRPGVFGTGS